MNLCSIVKFEYAVMPIYWTLYACKLEMFHKFRCVNTCICTNKYPAQGYRVLLKLPFKEKCILSYTGADPGKARGAGAQLWF